MKRVRINLEEVVARSNLVEATWRAARGKRHRPEVRAFLAKLNAELAAMRTGILDGSFPLGRGRTFRIRDPKPRLIQAPCFPERVLHQALIHFVGPVLERSLVDDSYACRVGKGSHVAVQRAQQHGRRFPWYAKLDVRSYFASIDQEILRSRLRRKIKGEGVLGLLDRILLAYDDGQGRGLPIGALTSQVLANFMLDPLDRFLLETCRVRGLIRYMDDTIFWVDSRLEARRFASEAVAFLRDQLKLEAKGPAEINRSVHGIRVCGYRVTPTSIRPSLRRRRRCLEVTLEAERSYLRGETDASGLQRAHDTAMAIVAHGSSRAWRRKQWSERTGRAWTDTV